VGWIDSIDNYLYVTNGSSTGNLTILDLTDPSNPVQAGVYETSGGCAWIGISGHYAFVSTAEGLRVLDITDRTAPALIGSLPISDAPIGWSEISGNYLFGNDVLGGKMYVIDLVPEG
jgi:hypothetical protein